MTSSRPPGRAGGSLATRRTVSMVPSPLPVQAEQMTRLGAVVVLGLGDDEAGPPDSVVASLHPDERALITGMAPPRRWTFAGGRIALRRALVRAGMVGGPWAAMMSSPRGAPLLPPGYVGSVSHKTHTVVAIAAREADVGASARLGIDLEDWSRPRDIASRVLRPEEAAAVASLPDAQRAAAVIARFSMKEAVYKALDPFVGRFVGFLEARVDVPAAATDPQADRGAGPVKADIVLDLKHGEGPFAVDGWFLPDVVAGHVVSLVRIRPAPPRGPGRRTTTTLRPRSKG